MIRFNLRRLLSLSIVLVFAAAFYNMSVCERAHAAKPDDGTTSGSGWDSYSSSSTGSGNVGSGKPWKSFGNDDIDETQHFLGTTDDNDIVIKTNNTEKARITSEGNVGIGTDAPTGTLHVEGGSAVGADDGTDITINAQDGGPDGGAGGNIVLTPGTGSGFVTDDDGNPVQATGEDGSPLFEEDENGNLVPVFIPNSGNVIIDGNLAPSSGHTITLGTPDLRYSGIYLASWFKYDTDGLYFYYTADERTPKDYFHARFTVDATPYIGGDGWTYFDVDAERSGNFIISPDALFESPLGTEKLQVDGDVMSTGNVEAVSYTGDGSALSGVLKDAAGVTALGFVTGAHTVDTNTQLSEAQVDGFVANNGFSTGAHTTKYTDAEAVAAVGAHTVDTDTTRSDAEIVDAVSTAGYVSGAHTTKYTDAEAVAATAGEHYTDADAVTAVGPHTSDADIATMGYVKDQAGIEALVGAHTVDTDTTRSDAEIVDAVSTAGYVSGAHTSDANISAMGYVKDQAGIEALVGAHTVDTDTTRSDADIVGAVSTAGYVSGAHTSDDDISAMGYVKDQAGIEALVGAHTVDTDTTRSDAEIVGAVSTAGYVSGAHTSDIDIATMGYVKDQAGIEALVGTHTKAGLWDSNGNSVYYNDGFVGIGTGAAVPGAELEVRGNIIADIPTADNHLATKAYVDAASGGGGGCYVSYSGSCLSGFTSQGSAGLWGYCRNSSNGFWKPPGGECIHSGWQKINKGEAYVCCK